MQNLSKEDFNKIAIKFEEFMRYSQKVMAHDRYLIVSRNSPVLAKAAEEAAVKFGLDICKFNLDKKSPYQHFPRKLAKLLQDETPKAGIGLFDYSSNPDWNLKEVGARIEFLHKIVEQVPISWAHSPGISLDMALNGPLQCNYEEIAAESGKILQKLQAIEKIRITASGGTDIEIEIPKSVKFDTDCTIVPPNVYNLPGKFGNLPVGEVWAQKNEIIRVSNNLTGEIELQSYPVKHLANGRVVCDITVGGFSGRINPEKPLIAHFQDGILTDLQCRDSALDEVRRDILDSQRNYGLATVLEEVGIGLNKKARVTGNMLEDEKIRGTCHIAPGNVRCHVDMLVNEPTIIGYCSDGAVKEIMRRGILIW
jgi:hypothetical protein